MNQPLPTRDVWSYFSTPLRVFLGVVGPIAGMMGLLAAAPGVPGWMRVSAGVVVAVTLYGLIRGYGRRVVATPQGLCFQSPRRRIQLTWPEIRGIASYVPLDRNLKTRYVYATRLDTSPIDWREIDENTIQLQDRPGLLDALKRYHATYGGTAPPD